jgi:predicted dehydrogenase
MNTSELQWQSDRRGFLRSAAGAGAALAFAQAGPGAYTQGDQDEPVNVALIGAGAWGEVLVNACRRIPGVRVTAVCDIWEGHNLKRISRIVQRFGQPSRPYADYVVMLEKEKDLQAAIVATPDFWHARHTSACLDAGLHVYCEAPMSNRVPDARRMVEAAQRSGKLLQIGQQRRSNPQYLFCCEKLLKEVKLLGRIVAVNGQWNRAVQLPRGWPKRAEIDSATLRKYGYKSMEEFRNWRWYKGLGSGPVVDLGAHQVDVYNWFLGARPTSVLASGHTNYYNKATHEWYDTVVAVYEYETPQGAVTASYQVLPANQYDGYIERFLGDSGTLAISQRWDRTRLYPDLMGPSNTAPWVACLKKGDLTIPPEWRTLMERQHVTDDQFLGLFVHESLESPGPIAVERLSCGVPVTMDEPTYQPHLENFFEAIRGRAKLTCPAEVGYETAVTVLKINEAAEAGRKLEFTPEEFGV